MIATVDQRSLDKLLRNLDRIGRETPRRAAKPSLEQIARAAVADIKAGAPPGLVRDSITARPRSYKGGSVLVYVVGPRSIRRTDRAGNTQTATRAAWLVEKGRVRVVPPAGGALRFWSAKQGKLVYTRSPVAPVPAKPFVKPTVGAVRAKRSAFMADVLSGIYSLAR